MRWIILGRGIRQELSEITVNYKFVNTIICCWKSSLSTPLFLAAVNNKFSALLLLLTVSVDWWFFVRSVCQKKKQHSIFTADVHACVHGENTSVKLIPLTVMALCSASHLACCLSTTSLIKYKVTSLTHWHQWSSNQQCICTTPEASEKKTASMHLIMYNDEPKTIVFFISDHYHFSCWAADLSIANDPKHRH